MNTRQRTKVNAMLCYLHGNGHDASAITTAARAAAGPGRNMVRGYQTAIDAYVARYPDLTPHLSRLARLVDNSDHETVARYNAALSAYIETGDESALAPVAETAMRDSVELAIQAGEISAADFASGNVDWAANGIDPMEAAAVFTPGSPPAAPQSFAFGGQPPSAPATTAPTTLTMPSYIRTEAGYRSVPTGDRARQEAGVPLPTERAVIRTPEGGYRSAPTGERLAREVGLPLSLFQEGASNE